MSSPKPRTSAVPEGTEFEYRVARLRFTQGYFVRRSIDVWPRSTNGDKLAELDCLALAFDPQLRHTVEVIECKTSPRGGGEIDRLIWLRGVSQLVGTPAVTFAKTGVAERSRELARRLRVDMLDGPTITTLEKDLGIEATRWPGFHNPELGETVVKRARRELNSAPELQRAGKYLFGSFWFTDDFARVKQLRTLVRLLAVHKDTLPPEALLLGAGEAVVLFVLSTLSLCSWLFQQREIDFRRMVSDELSAGLGDSRNLRLLLRRLDSLQQDQIEQVHTAYAERGFARAIVPRKNLEEEVLKPPEWVDAYVDLLLRLSKRPHIATDLVRWADLWAAQLLGAETGPADFVDLFPLGHEELQDHFSLILAFLVRVWGLPTHLAGLNGRQGQLPLENRDRIIERGPPEADGPRVNQQMDGPDPVRPTS